MQSQAHVPAQVERLEALRRKHSVIDKQIKEEQRRPAMSDQIIRSLKSEKLKVKDEIEGIRQAS